MTVNLVIFYCYNIVGNYRILFSTVTHNRVIYLLLTWLVVSNYFFLQGLIRHNYVEMTDAL